MLWFAVSPLRGRAGVGVCNSVAACASIPPKGTKTESAPSTALRLRLSALRPTLLKKASLDCLFFKCHLTEN